MILDNKLGITNQIELARAEEKISKQKAKQLFEAIKKEEGIYKNDARKILRKMN